MLTIHADLPMIDPPEWAVLQRSLITLMNDAVEPLMARYVRPDGRVMWPTTDDFSSIDGLDDAYESFHNWPLVAALGGGPHLGELGQREYDAITQQFTRYDSGHGHPMVVKEYEQGYDWMHQGEGYELFYLLALSGPGDATNLERAQRYAGFYMNEDPEAPNYDPQHKLMRSPHVGSMGPAWRNFDRHYRNYRYEQWKPWPLPFHDVPGITCVEDLKDNPDAEARMGQAVIDRMSRGDVVVNLASTSLVTHAFLSTGQDKYRNWVLDYVGAWMERAERNGGLVPDNVGLTGQIGEYIDGKWYGGYYGWTWPHGWHHIGEQVLLAAENATLLTGDHSYIDFARNQIQRLVDEGHEQDGTWHVPYFHHDGGWDGYAPMQARYLAHLWCLSQTSDDHDLILRLRDHVSRDYEGIRSHFSKHGGNHEAAWLAFLRGDYPDYPVDILRHSHAQVYQRLAFMADDAQDPATYGDWYLQVRNPVFAEALTQQTTGGPLFCYNGGLQMSRLRWFDAQHKRAGLPADVGALVTELHDDSATVELVNLHATQPRELIAQAGMFAEHTFTRVTATQRTGRTAPAPHMHATQHRDWLADQTTGVTRSVDSCHLAVHLPPASTVRLQLSMRRFDRKPTYDVP